MDIKNTSYPLLQISDTSVRVLKKKSRLLPFLCSQDSYLHRSLMAPQPLAPSPCSLRGTLSPNKALAYTIPFGVCFWCILSSTDKYQVASKK